MTDMADFLRVAFAIGFGGLGLIALYWAGSVTGEED